MKATDSQLEIALRVIELEYKPAEVDIRSTLTGFDVRMDSLGSHFDLFENGVFLRRLSSIEFSAFKASLDEPELLRLWCMAMKKLAGL